ncbi:MAG: hypothetical protein ACR2H2_00630, partial [Solirubrobacteraceae bacterium]
MLARITTKQARRRLGPRVTTHAPQVLAPPDPPSPSEREWSYITREKLGVHAVDPLGHKIGPNIAKKTPGGLNWYPVDRYKQTLVGTVAAYDFYDPTFSGDEADWNIFIKPTPAFQFICDDVLPNADPKQVHRA